MFLVVPVITFLVFFKTTLDRLSQVKLQAQAVQDAQIQDFVRLHPHLGT